MRLFELTGTKKYRKKTLWDVLRDFEKVGGQIVGSGKQGTVIWHPRWPYVFKMFERDDQYLRFIRFAKRHQDIAAFPRVLGGPWRIVPFYKRPANNPYLYVVKLERLEEITDPDLKKNIADYIHWGWQSVERDQHPEADAGVAAYREGLARVEAVTDRMARRQAQEALRDLTDWRSLSEVRDIWERHPTLRELSIAYNFLMRAGLMGQDDLHAGNFMQRSDGTLVMIDPLWAGESIYQMYDAAMKAELDFGDDDENQTEDPYATIEGGKLRPPKRPKPALPPPTWGGISSDDLPF